MSDKVSLDFTYRVTYPNGKGYDIRNKGTIAVNELSRSEYIEVAKYTASSGDLNASYLNPVLSGVVTRMKERVIELDMYHSMNGQYLSKALKKPREIEKIEVWVYGYDVERFKRMEDIDAVFSRPEQSFVLTRYDGSTVKVTVKDGLAIIQDSRKPGQYCKTEEDRLADNISYGTYQCPDTDA